MKKFVLIGMLMFSSVAMAQPGGNSAPLAVVPNEYVLKVKPADVDKIGKGLGKIPFEEVAELMQSLREQIVQQQQPAKIEPDKK